MVTHRIMAYLIGLALGYWVLTLAAKEKGSNQKIGKVIGWIIIVVSFIGPLCLAASSFYCHSHPDTCIYSSGCPWNNEGNGHMMDGKGMMGDTDKSK